MARTRRRFSAALKARVALEAIRGQRTVADLAGEHQVHPNQISQWKKQLLDASEGMFADRRLKQDQQQQELIDHLYQQIGQLKVEVDFLKKKLWTN